MSVASILADFAKGTGTGAFPKIDRADVSRGLQARVANAATIKQGAASLCGPAAFMYCLLQDRPEMFVQYVCDLYNTGAAKIGALSIKPSQDCRNYQPSGIAAVDWIALAGLRDSENVLDYQDPSDTFSGITMPSGLASWFSAAGYDHVQNDTNLVTTKGATAIDAAGALLMQNRRVCLFVDADLLEDDKNTSPSIVGYPDHWVVLTGTSGTHGGQVGATVWTWGRYVRIPGGAGDLKVEQFSGFFYGYVAAMFAPP